MVTMVTRYTGTHLKLFKADRRQKIALCQLTLIMFMLRSITHPKSFKSNVHFPLFPISHLKSPIFTNLSPISCFPCPISNF